MNTAGTRTSRKLSGSQRLVFDFFKTFSRLEYALKEAGFVRKSDQATTKAEPNWDEFTTEIDARWDSVVAAPEVRSACAYLLENAPMKQVVRDRELEWTALVRGGDSDARFVLRCVRTIRNNLFHGGKKRKISPERDEPLLRSGLAVLLALVPVNADVKYYYDDDT